MPAIILLAILFLACGKSDPAPVVYWVEVPVEVIKEVPVEVLVEVPVEVPVEVLVEVPVEVPVEVIVEVPVTPANCPTTSEVEWLIASLWQGRLSHVQWSEILLNEPPPEGSALQRAVGGRERQLSFVAMYDHRLSVASQLQKACQ